MKITKRQLGRIIKEASSDDWENRRNRWAKFKHHMAREPQIYLDWVEKSGHVAPSSSSVMATYFLEMGLENEHKIHKKLASDIGLDHKDVMREMNRQKSEQAVNLGESRMSITKRQLRSIIKEEQGYDPKPIDADAQTAARAVGGYLFDILEELGSDAQSAREIHHILKTSAWLDDALDKTLDSYLKKLNRAGGMPKPRSI